MIDKDTKLTLDITHPELCKEWDYEKNAPLIPGLVTRGSDIRVWWKCANGHSWKTKVSTRGVQGCNCNICRLEAKSLSVVFPELAKEWDYEKNYPLTPKDVSIRDEKHKIWWLCKNGHSWQRTVRTRAKDSNKKTMAMGCPFCSGKRIHMFPLAETHPTLAEEWNYEKNIDLTPDAVLAGSENKVWWK